MAGISQFYQGETGTVSETWWLAGEERLSYVVFIEGNRHRHLVTDSGSDIKWGSGILYITDGFQEGDLYQDPPPTF